MGIGRWGCLVNVELVEGEGWAAVKHPGCPVVEIENQHCQRFGNFGRVWSLQENFQVVRTCGPDDAGELEQGTKNAEGILGSLVEPIKLQSQHALGIGSGQFQSVDQICDDPREVAQVSCRPAVQISDWGCRADGCLLG